ncbi:GTP-binding protein [Alloacidobacterium sp.]|uniref:GTP-binding protein n=1 Tax=Alloacidobacterium sp. TaxID=2951999 RepID=UPI002D50217C|nr:GTP-binding protein [Alloacidobacterium sp.]HYK37784.1 GTP-binding protein [Alloacidobacterium sp.]
MNTERPWVVVVGGFLGAGKTTLILTAAQLLAQRGLRSAVILNDQGDTLVDTHQVEMSGVIAGEVTGGCFCCRFSKLITAMEALHPYQPDVIFAEPVGSCTDIAATVLAPLREEFNHYRLAPFTVLVDPARAAALQNNENRNLTFLFRRQLQEADLVCITKTDIYPDASGLSGIHIRHLSGKTGQGVREWLDEILSGTLMAGAHTIEIDYEQYAQAEAALAWLNLSCVFTPTSPMSPASVVGPLLDRLDQALTAAGIAISHLKVMDCSSSGWLKAAICANGEEAVVDGDLDASSAEIHDLLLNLRATGNPAHVQEIVENELACFEHELSRIVMHCFSPAPPKPERRIVPS